MDEFRSFANAPLVYGRGSLSHLSRLNGHRAAVLTDDVAMESLGYLQQAMGYFEEAGIEVQIVARIGHEPTTADIDRCRVEVESLEPDWIIALGGGSVMDAAKAVWVFAEHPHLTWEQVFQFNQLPLIKDIRMAAIPTTSGTGSETSRVAVLVDGSTGMKKLIFSAEIIPSLAIIDPNLPSSMPPALTACTAFDALCHAIESNISNISTTFTSSMANAAIRMIFKFLPRAYHSSDAEARDRMHYASTIAGMAINNSTVGLAHAMDQIGPLFDISHGLVCAVLLPYTLAFVFDTAEARLAEMGRAIGLPESSETELASGFLQALVSLMKDVELPVGFAATGISEKHYFANIDTLTAATLESGSAQLAPRMPTADEAEHIFADAYFGRLPAEVIA
jgi:alcohol dehydrogenase class IV